ncbi:serine/threonine-protein kinase [Agromyces aurantiacus]|uniref:non-specific serine/threonine protein kinase n=1 Tax=Agromyces aurantiacus TaxID=165814 RepID=A0ABV9RC75_9MICO|nr:serine/threonine-protein kinase [Agromyces aurantiacus]MBM7505169.1 cytoskeletal protein RodZ [Agromyces aurantiacus]
MSTPNTLVADRYRLVKLIGTGGMGVVWHAHDERLQRPVALKMLRPQPELTDEEREVATARAMREARINAGLHHPNAVPVFDVVEHEGRPCLVMQLIDSTPLSVLLQEHGPLTPPETARIGAQVAAALAAAHRLRIVHRDVKPGNILIREDGSAMISDFGIAHALGDTTITGTGMVHGTPAYLAPEAARGDASGFPSDVFSLGSTLYAMLEGSPPFGDDRNAIALLHRVARGEHPAPAHAGALAPLLAEMLAVDPKQRPRMDRVAERLAELDAALADGSPPTLPLGAVGAATGMADVTAIDVAAAAAPAPTVPSATRVIGGTAETERMTEVGTDDEDEQDDRVAAEPGAPLFPWLAQPIDEPATAPERAVSGPGPASAGDREHPRRRRGALIAAVVVVALLALGGILLAGVLRPDGGPRAEPDPDESSAAAETSEPAPTPSESPSREPSASPEPTPVPAPTPTPAPAPAPQTAEERAVDAVVSYYSLMPGDLDAAWPLMTADYQVNHVGGRDAYQAFWGDVSDVEASDVSASAPDRVQATLVYTFTDGRVVREVTAYRLVDESGTLKIAETTVLSSEEL